LLFALTLVVFLLGVLDRAEAAQQGQGGALRLLFWQAPTVVNPHLSIGSKDLTASRMVYEPLATFDKDGRLIPFLAAEIPSRENGGVAPDGRSVTWRLKKGVTWADGIPFTADDVLFTFEYASNPDVRATSRASYTAVERIEIIDDHGLTVHFKDVNPAWAVPFVGSNGMIIPRHLFRDYAGANAKDAPTNLLAVGTGPYKVAAFEESDILIIGDDVVSTIKITYLPNSHFREPDKPFFGAVELIGGGDAAKAAEAVLRDGSIDYAYNLQVDIAILEALEALGKGKLLAPPTNRIERIMLNFTDPNRETEDGERSSTRYPHPVLSDPSVRRALALSVDRAAVAKLYGRAGRPARNILISPAIFASSGTSWKYDLEQAAAILNEAGWIDGDGDGIREKDGVPLRLVYQTSVNAVRQRTQDMIKQALQSIGFEIELRIIDSSIFFGPVTDNTNTRRHFYADLEEFSFSNKRPDPGACMRGWTCGEAAQMSNNWSAANWSRYCNPAYDALYEESRTELDPEKRRALIIKMNDLLIADAAVLPLVERSLVLGISPSLAGVDPTPWDSDVWNIKDWRRKQP
jgi:peptide/nickel transport system substrate-binding protein